MGKRRNVAAQGTNVPAKQEAAPRKLPVPDGWYDLRIVDVDPEYRPQNSTNTFVVLKLRLTSSLRYKDRTFNLFVGENMTGTTKDKREFDSQRAQIIERFGQDCWANPDFFLDLVVRGHVTEQPAVINGQNMMVNRVVSIYPKVDRATEPVHDDLQEEIPF